MKNFKNQILVMLCLGMLMSCGTTQIYYQKNKEVRSALMSNKQPFKVQLLNGPVINMGQWRLDAISVSPDNRYLALASILFTTSAYGAKSKLEIYDTQSRQIKYTYTTADLKQKFRINSSTNYGDLFYMLHAYKLGFKDNKTLMIQVQPYGRSDELPLDAQLVINLDTNTSVSSKLVPRGDYSEITSLPSRSRNVFNIENGKMYVDGKLLINMPIDLTKLHTEVLLGN